MQGLDLEKEELLEYLYICQREGNSTTSHLNSNLFEKDNQIWPGNSSGLRVVDYLLEYLFMLRIVGMNVGLACKQL